MEKEVYKGQIIRVTEEVIDEICWERAYLPHGVIVFPINEEGKILLIREKRPHESPPVRLKPISGILEPSKGTPLENAQREMQEEVGLKAEKLELFLTLAGTGTINHTQYFFTATGLSVHKIPNPDGEEVILGTEWFSPEELYQKVRNQELKWSISTLGIFKLLMHLNKL